MEVYWRFKVLLCNLKNNGLLIASTWKRNPESFTFHLFMVLQLFTFDFYCFGIKVSKKKDVYCFYVCHTFIYCFYVCHMCIYCFYVCHMCIYLYCFHLHGCVCTLHRFSYGTKHLIFVWYKTFFFPIYSAKFRIKYPTNETKLIHKLRRTNLPRNNFCKCLMFSKIFLSLNSSVHLSTTLVQHGTIIS